MRGRGENPFPFCFVYRTKRGDFVLCTKQKGGFVRLRYKSSKNLGLRFHRGFRFPLHLDSPLREVLLSRRPRAF